jgi:hypothetical protein
MPGLLFGATSTQLANSSVDVSCLRSFDERGVFVHPRESSDNPRLNAFCRVAPSLRLRLLAIFLAGVLLRAADFNSRTSALVQARLFEFLLAMNGSPNRKRALIPGSAPKRKFSSTNDLWSVIGVDKSGSARFLICPAAVIFWSYFRLSSALTSSVKKTNKSDQKPRVRG